MYSELDMRIYIFGHLTEPELPRVEWLLDTNNEHKMPNGRDVGSSTAII